MAELFALECWGSWSLENEQQMNVGNVVTRELATKLHSNSRLRLTLDLTPLEGAISRGQAKLVTATFS